MRHGDKPGRIFNQFVGLKTGLRPEYIKQPSGRLYDVNDLLELARPEPEKSDTCMHGTSPFVFLAGKQSG